jgi:glycosyltransferase involved in cell wall biosynthesis
MAYGKPVVVSNSQWFTSIIVSGQNGLIAPMNDPKMLAKAINQILANENLGKFLGKNLEKDAQTYSWSNTATQLSNIFEEIERA